MYRTVDTAIARNCTGISPCQQDATIIRQAEIDANIVNECGRTELTGNIDVGENTENALAAGAVTQVTAGSSLTVTIHQVNADGAGPYVCDLDQTSEDVLYNSASVSNTLRQCRYHLTEPDSHQQRAGLQRPVSGKGAGFQHHGCAPIRSRLCWRVNWQCLHRSMPQQCSCRTIRRVLCNSAD